MCLIFISTLLNKNIKLNWKLSFFFDNSIVEGRLDIYDGNTRKVPIEQQKSWHEIELKADLHKWEISILFFKLNKYHIPRVCLEQQIHYCIIITIKIGYKNGSAYSAMLIRRHRFHLATGNILISQDCYNTLFTFIYREAVREKVDTKCPKHCSPQ